MGLEGNRSGSGERFGQKVIAIFPSAASLAVIFVFLCQKYLLEPSFIVFDRFRVVRAHREALNLDSVALLPWWPLVDNQMEKVRRAASYAQEGVRLPSPDHVP